MPRDSCPLQTLLSLLFILRPRCVYIHVCVTDVTWLHVYLSFTIRHGRHCDSDSPLCRTSSRSFLVCYCFLSMCHVRHLTLVLPTCIPPYLSYFVTVIPCMLMCSFCLSRSSLKSSHPYICRSIQNDSKLIEFSLFVAVSHGLHVTAHFPLWHSEPQSSRDTRLPAASRRDQKKTFIIINSGFAQFQTTECAYVCVNVCMQVCLNL